VYAIPNGDTVTMIDSGWAVPEARAALESGLALIDYRLADIDEFLITHSHSDHFTLGVALRAEFGMRLSVGRREQPNIQAVMENWDNGFKVQFSKLEDAGAGEIADAIRAQLEANPADLRMAEEYFELPDRWLDGGETFMVGEYELRAVHTPGHTDGHIVFVDATAGIAFTGDHVLPTITPSVSFEAHRPALPLRSFLDSQAAMLRLPDMRVLPAHGHVTDSLHARSRELMAYHELRLDDCSAAVAAGAFDALGVSRALGWTRSRRAFGDLDAFNQMLAVSETVVHLDLLVHRGDLTAIESDGVRSYRVAA